MDRRLGFAFLLIVSLSAGCGGSDKISPAQGFDDCVQIGDTVYTVDGEYDAGGTYGTCDSFRTRGFTPVPMPKSLRHP